MRRSQPHQRRQNPDAGRKENPIEIALSLGAILLLILIHAFFVAAEFGLLAVERDRVESEAATGSRRARLTLQALKTLSFQMSGVQLGITITSLIVGFLAGPAIGELIRPLLTSVGLSPRAAVATSLTLALLIATAAEMVLAELLPKSLAISRPSATAYATAAPLLVVTTVLRPVILFLNAAANFTVRRLGIEPRDELLPVRSLKELELLIHRSRAEGSLHEDEFSLLSRSISFGEKTASDALTPRTAIVALRKDASVARLAECALESGRSRFPVYGDDLDDILGIATVKDCYRYPPAKRPAVPVTEIIREAMVIPESRPLEELLVDLRQTQNQLAIVIDEYGGTAGVVTIEDLLEEIVGEIEDEYDPSESPARVTAAPSGVGILAGTLHADEVKEACGFEIPDGPYDTLAGFLLWLLDRIPEQGDHASHRGWELKVVEMDRNRIAKVLVVAPPEGEESR